MDSSLELADGRFLSYAIYGDRNGSSILLFHGIPGSRLWFEDDDPVAREAGLQLIACDRPGYGLSDPNPARTFVDWADDVLQFAEGLGLERFRILSVSGGGPFALACAHQLGLERITGVTLVAAPSPREGDWDKGMARANRVGFLLMRWLQHGRWLGRILLRSSASFACSQPEAYFDRMAKELCPSDRDISERPEFRRQVHRELVEAYRQGVDGLLDELILLSRPWGFDLAQIEVPVDLWHGSDDTLAPFAMAERLHARLPRSRLHRVPGRGHFLIDEDDRWREVLSTL